MPPRSIPVAAVITLGQNIGILLAVMAASLLFMVVINRVMPVASRYNSNDQIGWQLNVLGTTYAVILGFMLYTSWTTFGAADLNAELEASALRNIFWLAQGLPAEQKSQLASESRAYADAVIKEDWPAMAHGALPEMSHAINQSMWRTLISIKDGSTPELAAMNHALSELGVLTLYRRTRLLQSQSRLPAIFWCVLLIGGALTLVSVSMFGSRNPRLHVLQVFSLTLLITLVMLAIADVNCPYQGWVHVSVYPFNRAADGMREIQATLEPPH